MASPRLGPADWCDAALDAIAADGVDALAIERLAPMLGVSKGSFYWHFKNRDALLEAAAARWEQLRLSTVNLGELDAIADPRQRLLQLFKRGYGSQRLGRIEAAFAMSRDHPAVAPVLRRIAKQRMRYLVALFREMGFDERQTAARARVAYGTYLGLVVVTPALAPPPAGSRTRFLEDLVGLLTK